MYMCIYICVHIYTMYSPVPIWITPSTLSLSYVSAYCFFMIRPYTRTHEQDHDRYCSIVRSML